ncbi:MAG: FGGY-family carbohydrate kinase, partial [Candidatus Marinimicrobia bacterium]|nr:FGGY-family carbohydrate kinase [Candidatus Neomarinimicrobiota bacterium]
QIYADVTGRPMKISRSEQTPALGAAIFTAVAAGRYVKITDAQQAMTGTDKVFYPNEHNHEVYQQIYTLYRQMHDAFGTPEWSGSMYNVMKGLIDIRDRVKQE